VKTAPAVMLPGPKRLDVVSSWRRVVAQREAQP